MRQLTIGLAFYSTLVILLFIAFFRDEYESRTLRIGDCVREIGDTNVRHITAITDSGAIETKTFWYSYPDYKKLDEYYLTGYNAVDRTKLIKINCETGETK